MMKVGWNLVARRDELWAKVLRSKYSCGSDIIPTIDMTKPGSNLWRGVKRTWNNVQDGVEVMSNGTPRWKWSKSGNFTVRSAYEHSTQDETSVDPIWGKNMEIKDPRAVQILSLVGSTQSASY
ncbi:hypothetical protein QN277_028896 [Acacia crassicarpa]|uniref:Uncharacterized protein n=1 Tax=Acacia crassicarpa TaxID=499986 RepID=A0AAE1MDN6_9FABA|nr:hypothetical protein QN277_028896 [Acacia crassicarpa]